MTHSTSAAERRPSPRRKRPGHDVAVVVLHWTVTAAFVVALLTGWAIAAYEQASPSRFPGVWLREFLPAGFVHRWHLISALLLPALLLGYAGYLLLSRQYRRLRLTGNNAAHSAVEPGSSPARQRRARRRRALWATWILLGLLAVSLASGLLLYEPSWWGWPSAWVAPLAWLHGVSALLLLAAALWHALSQWMAEQVGKIFRARVVRLQYAALAAVFLALSLGLLYATEQQSLPSLRVPRVTEGPRLDGTSSDAAWRQAPVQRVVTQMGDNFEDGATVVEVRAVHDGMDFFLLAQWEDPTHSQTHLPLERTARGWQLREEGFLEAEESRYYEDKLAVLLSPRELRAADFTRLGSGLEPGPHLANHRGLHSFDEGFLDLWHWKSLRTGRQRPAKADDNHFGPVLPSVKPGVRYTGGYQKDWGSGGYQLNFCLRSDPDCRQVMARIARTGEMEKIPGSSIDRVRRCLAAPDCEEDLIPIYLPEKDSSGEGVLFARPDRLWTPAREAALPAGARVPGVVLYSRLNDDRGDVRAEAQWKEGRWTVELQRSLRTGTRHDTALQPGESVYAWFAPFDASQTGHSRHHRPVRLDLAAD